MSVQPSLSGVFVDWTVLKTIVDANSLIIQYTEDTKKYNVWSFNGPSLIRTSIYKEGISVGGLDTNQNDTDRVDFETNYKPGANGLDQMSIRVEANTSINANIDATQAGNVLTNSLRYDTLTDNQSISNSSFTTIYSCSNDGVLFGVFLELNWDDMELEVHIDGVKIIDGLKLISIPICGSGNSGHGPIAPFIGRLSSKELAIQPPHGIKYQSDIIIKLKSSSNNKKLVSGYVVVTKES